MGIEPTQSAWKAEILPLNYTRSSQSDFDIIPAKKGFVNSFFENYPRDFLENGKKGKGMTEKCKKKAL